MKQLSAETSTCCKFLILIWLLRISIIEITGLWYYILMGKEEVINGEEFRDHTY